ncbi:MAG: response regulator, partial [Novibacillus thermophilus]
MSKRVLIVDDAAFMRMMIKDILTKNGYEVVAEASDGAQAVEKYKEHNPDL